MFTFIDLFCGIGGFRQGLSALGGKCVYSADIDKLACEYYYKNYGELCYNDVTKVNPYNIPDHDILCGGFPCQPFSSVGRRLGLQDSRGVLFLDIMRIAMAKQPKVLFLENVLGLIQHNNGNTLNTIFEYLKYYGYNPHYTILNSNDFGLAQRRKRLYIVAVKVNEPFLFPVGSDNTKRFRDICDISSNVQEDHYYSQSSVIRTYYTDSKYKYRSQVVYFKGVVPTIKKTLTGDCAHIFDNRIRQSRNTFNYRCLTNNELKLAQGFPINFQLPDSPRKAHQLIGNSVTPPVIEAIGKNILNTYF